MLPSDFGLANFGSTVSDATSLFVTILSDDVWLIPTFVKGVGMPLETRTDFGEIIVPRLEKQPFMSIYKILLNSEIGKCETSDEVRH